MSNEKRLELLNVLGHHVVHLHELEVTIQELGDNEKYEHCFKYLREDMKKVAEIFKKSNK
jgi:hypothetical protein